MIWACLSRPDVPSVSSSPNSSGSRRRACCTCRCQPSRSANRPWTSSQSWRRAPSTTSRTLLDSALPWIARARSCCASTSDCSSSAPASRLTHRFSMLQRGDLKRAASRADDEHGQMLTGELQFDLSADDQGLFLAEVDELLQRVEESLVDLERAPDDRTLLNEIFRAAHTIKGSSATIGHTRMAALTHAMQTRLDDVRKGIAAVTPQLIEALLKAVDVLKLLRDEVETRVAADVDVDAAASAVERRAGLRTGAADRRRAPKHTTSPTENVPGASHRFAIVLEDGPWLAVRALQALLTLGEH